MLTASAAAVPLFLSSAGTAAMEAQAAQRCPAASGATIDATNSGASYGFRSTLKRLVQEPGLGTPREMFTSATAFTIAAPGHTSQGWLVQLMARDGAVDHIEKLEDSGQPGVWVADSIAAPTGLGAGDQAEVAFGPVILPVTVAGVYRDLGGRTPDDYWCSISATLQPQGATGDLPAPLLLTDRETAELLWSEMGLRYFNRTFEVPLEVDDVTLPQAQRIADQFATWPERLDRQHLPTLRSTLPFIAGRSDAIVQSVGGGVVPVAAAAAIAGLVMVGAAASLWSDRRQQEIVLLTVRGVSPAGIGVKAVLELLVAVLAGGGAGLGIAYALVIGLGPSPRLDSGAVLDALVLTGAAAVLAAVTLGATAAMRARPRSTTRRHRGAWLRVVPWELGFAVLAYISHRRLSQWGVPSAEGADVTRVDRLGLAFPLFFLAASLTMVARLFGIALRMLRQRSRTWPTPLYLAVRRLASHRLAAISLAAASAASVAVLSYSATLTDSLHATLDAKVRTFVGSDVAVQLTSEQPIPAELQDQATTLLVAERARVDDVDVHVLAIDPDTYKRAGYWEDGFSDRSLDSLLDSLRSQPADGGVPAIAVGRAWPEDTTVAIRSRETVELDLAWVGDTDVFPGMRGDRPTIVIAADAMRATSVRPLVEVWVRGDGEEVLEAFRQADTVVRSFRVASRVIDQTSFLTVAWTFGFMKSLGVAAAITTIGGLAIELDARRRARVVAYAFARRMGLSARSHRGALLTELSATIAIGCWLGLGLAVAAVWLAYTRVDPVPGIPPAPLLRPAAVLMVVLASGGLALAAIGARIAQRRADSDDPVEVLRAGV